MNDGSLTKDKEDTSIENLYNFIRASLLALQVTGGFGEADSICPICGGMVHIRRMKGELYNKGDIEYGCGCPFHFR